MKLKKNKKKMMMMMMMMSESEKAGKKGFIYIYIYILGVADIFVNPSRMCFFIYFLFYSSTTETLLCLSNACALNTLTLAYISMT